MSINRKKFQLELMFVHNKFYLCGKNNIMNMPVFDGSSVHLSNASQFIYTLSQFWLFTIQKASISACALVLFINAVCVYCVCSNMNNRRRQLIQVLIFQQHVCACVEARVRSKATDNASFFVNQSVKLQKDVRKME